MLIGDGNLLPTPLSGHLNLFEVFLNASQKSKINTFHMTKMYLKVWDSVADFGPSCLKDVRHVIVCKF